MMTPEEQVVEKAAERAADEARDRRQDARLEQRQLEGEERRMIAHRDRFATRGR